MSDKKTNDKVIELAFKLKALADRGEGGEKVNAKALLDKLLLKHGMTIDDLEVQDLKWQEFKVKLFQREFFGHIVDNVLGIHWKQYQHEKKQILTYVFCTNLEAIEIEGKFEFYWRVFQNDIPAFRVAFVRKNGLFPKDPKYRNEMNFSEEERKEMMKVFELEALATKAAYRKQLKAGENLTELK